MRNSPPAERASFMKFSSFVLSFCPQVCYNRKGCCVLRGHSVFFRRQSVFFRRFPLRIRAAFLYNDSIPRLIEE